MPELPEVETVRRDLARRLRGARLARLWTSGKALRLGRAVDVRALRRSGLGAVVALRRLSKYVVIDLEGGCVVVHLGMTGQLIVCDADAERAPHTHVVWTLADGRELRFVDPRRFGAVFACTAAGLDALPEIAGLGVDPLSPEFTPDLLESLVRRTHRNAKAFLMDQGKIAGVGNIYASEALFEAGIHPLAPVDRLKKEKIVLLHAAVLSVLRRALKNRGTTFRDYRDSSGERGQNQHSLRVYDRTGEPCVRCKAPIRRVVIQGRSTFFCPRCQRRS